MAKLIIGLIAVSAVAVIGIAVAGPATSSPSAEDDVRNLLLNAAGTHALKPGQVRIPVPVEGVEYEIAGVKPGEPKAVPVSR